MPSLIFIHQCENSTTHTHTHTHTAPPSPSHTVSITTSRLRTGTSCLWAWPWTPWGCGGSAGWRSPGFELSGPRCGSGRGPCWLCWGSRRSACCARRYVAPSDRGPYTQRTPAWLSVKATGAAPRQTSVCLRSLKYLAVFLSPPVSGNSFLSFFFKLDVSGPGQLYPVLQESRGAWDSVASSGEESQAEVMSKIGHSSGVPVSAWSAETRSRSDTTWKYDKRTEMEGEGGRRMGTGWVVERVARLEERMQCVCRRGLEGGGSEERLQRRRNNLVKTDLREMYFSFFQLFSPL